MSLLNDMLRDLSHQQSSMKTAAAANQSALDFNAQEQRELFNNTSAAKPLSRSLVPSLVVFVLVVAMLTLWKWHVSTNATIQADDKPLEADRVSVSPPPIQVNLAETKTTNAITTQAVDSTAPMTNAVESPSAVVVSHSVEPALGERLAALESAITTLSVVVANANNQTLNQLPAVEATPIATAEPAEPIDESISVEVAESVSIEEPFAPSVEAAVPDSVVPLVEEGEATLSIAPNAKWKDQQQSQQASQLVAQGQTDLAIERLQSFIDTAVQPRESLKTLLDIFAARENTDAMQALLAQVNYLSVVEQTFYTAKIASIKNEDAQAIQLLEAHLGEAERDENYRALLAGLYQRDGMHLEAANHYRRLLSVFGDKSAYWLGFALAQDALNQPQVAVQAFQRVNQYVDLQPQVRNYVRQRIAALQQ
jgi:tetratricopeptide (TPR) repeat protein